MSWQLIGFAFGNVKCKLLNYGDFFPYRLFVCLATFDGVHMSASGNPLKKTVVKHHES